MQWAKYAVLILAATVVQADLIEIIAVGNVKPDWLLILLVFFAIHRNTTEAIITSFTIGFASDLIGFPALIGPWMISFGVLGTTLAYLHRVIAIRQIPYQAAAIFIVGILAGILAHLLSSMRGQSSGANIYGVIFGTALYSALLGPFLFLLSAWWMNIKTTRRFKKN